MSDTRLNGAAAFRRASQAKAAGLAPADAARFEKQIAQLRAELNEQKQTRLATAPASPAREQSPVTVNMAKPELGIPGDFFDQFRAVIDAAAELFAAKLATALAGVKIEPVIQVAPAAVTVTPTPVTVQAPEIKMPAAVAGAGGIGLAELRAMLETVLKGKRGPVRVEFERDQYGAMKQDTVRLVPE